MRLHHDATHCAHVRTGNFHSRLPGNPPGLAGLLAGVRDHSPYLARLVEKYPETITELSDTGVDACMVRLREFVCALEPQMPRADFCRGLRRAKQQVHLVLALAELGQVWTCESSMAAFSDFACDCISAAMAHAFARYRLDVDTCGFFIIAFGKLAGRELNYSSDVDLAFFHDSHKLMEADVEPHKLVRAAREMVALLSEVSEHGYTFRVDLRLRPDPGSTPIVMSNEAAMIYFESMGQTWERAAWIKARPICGDRVSAEEFMVQMQPFIWRRYRDFAAIKEIHRIRQLALETLHADTPGEPGYNVKTGPGGIREIELLAQTLQLIHGGRETELQVGPSLSALAKLAEVGLVDVQVAHALRQHYFFLRTVEHAMQMHMDQQTHIMPETGEESEHVAALSGFNDVGKWQEEVGETARQVLELVKQAMPEHPQFGEGESNPFVLGQNSDAQVMQWLAANGFHAPDSALHVVRGWQQGNIRATRSLRARALLGDVLPVLMQNIAAREEPDHVLAKTARFLECLPAGVQMFSLIAHCPQLIRRLVDVLGASQWMAQALVENPQLLDTLLRTDQDTGTADGRLQDALFHAPDLESAMNDARRAVQDRRFQLGARVLGGDFDWREIAHSFSAFADVAIDGLAQQVWWDMLAGRNDTPPHWAVLGFGKLGSQEMGLLSDLDLVVVYEPEVAGGLTNAASLAARFTRRLVSALSAPTEAGGLFDVDMALRPSGRAGPVAVSRSAFASYYQNDAWVWEYLALTRARVVAASNPAFAAGLQEQLPELLAYCDRTAIVPDLAHMRLRLAAEKPQRFFWDIKHGPGGMMDLDFLVQARKLLRIVDRQATLPRASNEAQIRSLFHGISQVLSVTLGADAGSKVPDEPVMALLCSQTNAPGMEELQALLHHARAEVVEALAKFGV